MYARYVKRGVDVVAASIGLVLLSPLYLVVAIAVRRSMGAPVTFRQERPGRGGVLFTLVKFRTMTDARDEDGNLLPDQDRLPRAGRVLRSTSLDELPELWNVLRGDMSLVGPRPLLPEYLPLYSAHQARRHEVRPGITGWAQVNGRNSLSWAEKFDLDVWYVDNVSFALDVRILWRTVAAVVTARGVAEDGSATMSPFEGGS